MLHVELQHSHLPSLAFHCKRRRWSQSPSRGGNGGVQCGFGLRRTGRSRATTAQAAGVIASLCWTLCECECVQHGQRREATFAACRRGRAVLLIAA